MFFFFLFFYFICQNMFLFGCYCCPNECWKITSPSISISLATIIFPLSPSTCEKLPNQNPNTFHQQLYFAEHIFTNFLVHHHLHVTPAYKKKGHRPKSSTHTVIHTIVPSSFVVHSSFHFHSTPIISAQPKLSYHQPHHKPAPVRH